MTIVVICDDDSLICGLWPGEVDVLISCGDIADAAIQRAMARYRPRHVFAVRGNHDPNIPFPEGITDLHLETKTVNGVTFGGFEGSWRYKPSGHHLFDQREVSTLMQYFPKVDIFVAHNSPAGMHERDSDVHQGFGGFTDYIARSNPRLFIHGHQHCDRLTIQGNTVIAGVFGEKLIRFG